MTTAMRSNREVLDMVRRYVEVNQPDDFRLHVLDDAVMHITEGSNDGDDRWYVAVRHDPELPRLLERYSNVMMDIEDQIEQNEGVQVSLQSVLPAY